MLLNFYEEYPTVNVKQIEGTAYSWLNEIELEEYQDYVFGQTNVPALIAHTAAGINPDKLSLYFKLCVFFPIIDDDLGKLNFLNANCLFQHYNDISKLVKNFIFNHRK